MTIDDMKKLMESAIKDADDFRRKEIGMFLNADEVHKIVKEIINGEKPAMIKTLYERFQYWSKDGSVYILSDLHFDDSDCKLMDEEWISPEAQIEIINKTIMANDTFVCLGDVGSPKYLKRIRAKRKILILGNHDKKKNYIGYFDEIYDGPLFISSKILLSHEPIEGLDFCLNIHGHDHSAEIERPHHINLAANVCGYKPVSLAKIIKNGGISKIDSIHRQTIDLAIEKKKKGKKEETA